MTDLHGRPVLSPTSGGTPIPSLAPVGRIVIGSLVPGPETSAALPLAEPSVAFPPREPTSSGAPVDPPEPTAPAIAELRRLTGLTWDQLARLFGVSRRAVHFWASGKPMAADNEERLHRALAAVRRIDRGAARLNRSLLLTEREDGTIPLDLLTTGQLDRLVALVGSGDAHRLRRPGPAPAALAGRAPRRPDDLVEARQDSIHPKSGKLLGTKPVRGKRSK